MSMLTREGWNLQEEEKRLIVLTKLQRENDTSSSHHKTSLYQCGSCLALNLESELQLGYTCRNCSTGWSSRFGTSCPDCKEVKDPESPIKTACPDCGGGRCYLVGELLPTGRFQPRDTNRECVFMPCAHNLRHALPPVQDP